MVQNLGNERSQLKKHPNKILTNSDYFKYVFFNQKIKKIIRTKDLNNSLINL